MDEFGLQNHQRIMHSRIKDYICPLYLLRYESHGILAAEFESNSQQTELKCQIIA